MYAFVIYILFFNGLLFSSAKFIFGFGIGITINAILGVSRILTKYQHSINRYNNSILQSAKKIT